MRRAGLKLAATDPAESRDCMDAADILAFEIGSGFLASGSVNEFGDSDFGIPELGIAAAQHVRR